MFNTLSSAFTNVLTTISTSLSASTFKLEDVSGFPYEEYQKNLSKYREDLSWFLGTALDIETQSTTASGKLGKATPLYPVKINPLMGACLKHAAALFGDVQFDARPLVPVRFVTQDKSQKEAAMHATEQINLLWWENFGRSQMMENGIISQIYGGCVFQLTNSPWEERWKNIPIRISRVLPSNFVGIPISGDPYRLDEAWFVYPVTHMAARRFGVNVDEDDEPWWIEHWTRDFFTIQINGRNVTYDNALKKDFQPGGVNPYGFVPSFYIPHIRVGSFYGQNLIDGLEGLVKERNLRIADAGDSVNAATHDIATYKNVPRGVPEKHDLLPGLVGLNLGNRPQIGTGGDQDPDMKMLERRSDPAGHATELSDNLHEEWRRAAFLPAVAEGEDEGSQRSGATLLARMWPLIAHITQERIFWDDGLSWGHSMALRMMMQHGYGGITDQHIKLRSRNEWAPAVPKDREQLVNEINTRSAGDIGSPQHLMEMTGDIEDPEEELELILEWKKRLAEQAAEIAQKFAPKDDVPPGGNKPAVKDKKNEKSSSSSGKRPGNNTR